MKYPASELVIGQGNTVYHLGVSRDEVAKKIILVGDPERVEIISNHFDTIRHRSKNREFVVHTGSYNQQEISVISTGIGTDNIDIVINELDALFNIDFASREDEKKHIQLELIRIGTCGILQPEIPLHSFIVSNEAYGLDNIAHFYDIHFSEKEESFRKELNDYLKLPDGVHPYLTTASTDLLHRISSEQTFAGITITSCGFYGPQGRTLRIPHRLGNIYEKLQNFRTKDGQQILNFEMETSAFYVLGKELGHHCLTICLGAANRPNKEFSDNYHPHMERLIQYVLNRF